VGWSGDEHVYHIADMGWIEVALGYNCVPDYGVLRKGPKELECLQFIQKVDKSEVCRE